MPTLRTIEAIPSNLTCLYTASYLNTHFTSTVTFTFTTNKYGGLEVENLVLTDGHTEATRPKTQIL